MHRHRKLSKSVLILFGFSRGSQTLSCADPDKELLEVRNRETVMVQVSVEHILYVWVGVGAMLCVSD